jgi:hypothetical protein
MVRPRMLITPNVTLTGPTGYRSPGVRRRCEAAVFSLGNGLGRPPYRSCWASHPQEPKDAGRPRTGILPPPCPMSPGPMSRGFAGSRSANALYKCVAPANPVGRRRGWSPARSQHPKKGWARCRNTTRLRRSPARGASRKPPVPVERILRAGCGRLRGRSAARAYHDRRRPL